MRRGAKLKLEPWSCMEDDWQQALLLGQQCSGLHETCSHNTPDGGVCVVKLIKLDSFLFERKGEVKKVESRPCPHITLENIPSQGILAQTQTA